MNDKRIIYGLMSALAASMLSSCSQEDMQVRGLSDDDDAILFVTDLPGVETRSDETESLDDGFYVTAFAPEDETTIGTSNKLNEYFANQLVSKTQGMGNAFRSDMCRWPANTGTKSGTLKFYAFYPSLETLSERAGVSGNSSYFVLQNSSTKTATKTTYSYSINRFKIDKDISKHVDFVIATADGNKTANLYSGVSLNFEHQLSQVDLQAWGNSSTPYEVEIAGVRLGNVITESKFDFSQTQNSKTDNTTNGKWLTTPTQTKGIVEYIYREGDKVISVGRTKDTNTTAPNAISIMGNGGPAIVIPGTYSKWSTTAKTGFYYSVLLRVNDKEGKLLYPYIEGANMNSSKKTDEMNVVYLSVERTSGLVKKRVYKKDGIYYTSDELSPESIYNVPDEEEVRNYGWAAIPFNPTWKAGYQYIVRLGYSSGIGVMDPADVFPGKAIISEISSGVTVTSFVSQKEVDVSDIITIDPE